VADTFDDTILDEDGVPVADQASPTEGLGKKELLLELYSEVGTTGESSPGIADSGASSFTEYLLPYAGLVALAFALACGAFAYLVLLS
tara:strand:+ start:138 stop:401 length:264 start_codon:yes stop_codon:yes gene_type:complete